MADSAMWDSRVEQLEDGRLLKFAIVRDGATVPYSDVLQHWRDDEPFRRFFIALLVDAPLAAYRWETPPLTTANSGRDFEFVLLSCAALDRTVDPTAFGSKYSQDQGVVTFPNLGGDAIMVVPCPVADKSIYGHLASFVRNAPESQVHQLWQAVGEAMQNRVGHSPVWLSTAGMGVSWLHIRLDNRPKYYGYGAYKQMA